MKIEKKIKIMTMPILKYNRNIYNNVKDFGHQYISWNKKKTTHTSLEMNAINMLLWQN